MVSPSGWAGTILCAIDPYIPPFYPQLQFSKPKTAARAFSSGMHQSADCACLTLFPGTASVDGQYLPDRFSPGPLQSADNTCRTVFSGTASVDGQYLPDRFPVPFARFHHLCVGIVILPQIGDRRVRILIQQKYIGAFFR